MNQQDKKSESFIAHNWQTRTLIALVGKEVTFIIEDDKVLTGILSINSENLYFYVEDENLAFEVWQVEVEDNTITFTDR